MAAIDKIYATRQQRDELYEWCAKNYQAALQYFYDRDPEEWTDDKKELSITNFPTKVDMNLLEYCPIPWVVEKIKKQYGLQGMETVD